MTSYNKVATITAYFSTPVPNGFQALVSTGDGNCFYNSISILLSGNEILTTHLRLASVLHAVEHFNHYLTMVCVIKLPMYSAH